MEPIKKLSSWDTIKYILVILLVVGAGIFTMNQLIDYKFKAELLQQPCLRCLEQQPQLKECFYQPHVNVIPINWNVTQLK